MLGSGLHLLEQVRFFHRHTQMLAHGSKPPRLIAGQLSRRPPVGKQRAKNTRLSFDWKNSEKTHSRIRGYSTGAQGKVARVRMDVFEDQRLAGIRDPADDALAALDLYSLTEFLNRPGNSAADPYDNTRAY